MTSYQIMGLFKLGFEAYYTINKRALELKETEIISDTCRYGGQIKGTQVVCQSEEEANQMKIQLAPVQTN